MISILLLITVVCTHIADVCNHSEQLARDQNRIFAITIIVVSLRVFEVGRFVDKVNHYCKLCDVPFLFILKKFFLKIK
jgi:hypothetical protein